MEKRSVLNLQVKLKTRLFIFWWVSMQDYIQDDMLGEMQDTYSEGKRLIFEIWK